MTKHDLLAGLPAGFEQALLEVGDIPPWGVDVGTGVEGADYRKDPARMKAFVEAVRRHGDEPD